jgi:hypothetical protein
VFFPSYWEQQHKFSRFLLRCKPKIGNVFCVIQVGLEAQNLMPRNINLLIGFWMLVICLLHDLVGNLITLNWRNPFSERSWLDRVRIHVGWSLIMHKNRAAFECKRFYFADISFFICSSSIVGLKIQFRTNILPH